MTLRNNDPKAEQTMKPTPTRIFPVLAVALATTTACTGPGVLIGAGAVGARSILQERSTGQALADLEIEVSIANRLGRHSGELYRDVEVDVHDGRVLLVGSVPRREDRVFATQQAWDVPGVVAVTDELTVAEDGGAQAYLNDVLISNQVRLALLATERVRKFNFNVVTVDRVVHITGIARSQDELSRALDAAAGIDGVEKVVSHVILADARRDAGQPAE